MMGKTIAHFLGVHHQFRMSSTLIRITSTYDLLFSFAVVVETFSSKTSIQTSERCDNQVLFVPSKGIKFPLRSLPPIWRMWKGPREKGKMYLGHSLKYEAVSFQLLLPPLGATKGTLKDAIWKKRQIKDRGTLLAMCHGGSPLFSLACILYTHPCTVVPALIPCIWR